MRCTHCDSECSDLIQKSEWMLGTGTEGRRKKKCQHSLSGKQTIIYNLYCVVV